MRRAELQKAVSEYEGLFKSFEKIKEMSGRFPIGNKRVAYALCELYALMGALRIRAYIGASDESRIASSREAMGKQMSASESLPKYEAVQKASRDLFAAIAAKDQTEISKALEEMGVLALCPRPEQQFSRMDLVLGYFTGHSQLIPLAEIALFAAELEDYENAGKYASKVRSFDPKSWELYTLCMVEGLIALNAGRTEGAIQCMV